MTDFQPTMLGFRFKFEDEPGWAMITDESATAFYIESEFFTGWMLKTEFYENWGVMD